MLKKLTFSLFIIVTVVLISATIIEKLEGTTYIQAKVYSAMWFYILWGILSLFATIHILRTKLYRELSTFMLHASFIVILLGALVTALTAEQGSLYLSIGSTQSTYTNDNLEKIDLPFTITLKDFKVQYYSGTRAAADYISHIVFETKDKKQEDAIVAMNKIASFQGYRFYQSEYDNWGSTVSINRDIYGIPITYSGYILLLFSLISVLIAPNGVFRRLLRSQFLRCGAIILIFSLSPLCVLASSSNNELPKTLTKEQIKTLKDIQVVYNERVMPLTTLTHDFTLKLIGSTKYRGYSSNQFFWGWLLFPTQWEKETIFKVPLSEKQEFLNLREMSSYADFFTEKNVYKLNHYIHNTEPKTQSARLKELKKLNEKVQLVAMLRSGAMVKIFPYRDMAGHISWYAPTDKLPDEMDRGQKLFIQNSFKMLLEAFSNNNEEDFRLIASKIVSYQQKYGEESLIPTYRLRAEQLYYSLSVTVLLYRLNLTLGILAIIGLIVFARKGRVVSTIERILKWDMIFSLLLITIYIGLKWFITGRMPLVNGYDTMIFLGWSAAAITLFISRGSSLFVAMGTLLVGFTMLVATIGGMNPQITPLMPVLNSPFLTTHVCLIMLSYTLFAFTFINGILAITAGRRDKELMKRLTIYSKIFLILGLVLLTIGIFIGAVWANVSWGRYWAWDPKEVWALITMMIYALPLHSRSLSLFRNSNAFHIFLVVAFMSVLMTYFGVNYVLGGMHSYAS